MTTTTVDIGGCASRCGYCATCREAREEAQWDEAEVFEDACAAKRLAIILHELPPCDKCGHAAGNHGEELGVCTFCPKRDHHHYVAPRDEGRCYLCGAKTDRSSNSEGREFTLCEAHLKIVNRLEELEYAIAKKRRRLFIRVVDAEGTLSDNAGHDENLLGWGIFNDGNIERDDQADVFESDEEAAAYVARALNVRPIFPEGF